MTLARLLTAPLLLCCLSAFAQDQQPRNPRPSEPWRIIPNQPGDVGSGQQLLSPMRVDQFRFDPKVEAKPDKAVSVLDGQPDTDTICYSIRSYVVARDSKDSDSTHPAGYSTCRPASGYHVKNAQGRTSSGDR
jgi:hypothetical protein